jgi:hypothetical protein
MIHTITSFTLPYWEGYPAPKFQITALLNSTLWDIIDGLYMGISPALEK